MPTFSLLFPTDELPDIDSSRPSTPARTATAPSSSSGRAQTATAPPPPPPPPLPPVAGSSQGTPPAVAGPSGVAGPASRTRQRTSQGEGRRPYTLRSGKLDLVPDQSKTYTTEDGVFFKFYLKYPMFLEKDWLLDQGNGNSFKCKRCRKMLNSKKASHTHYLSCIGGAVFECATPEGGCDRQFTRMAGVRAHHFRTHEGDEKTPWVGPCSKGCGAMFLDYGAKRKHEKERVCESSSSSDESN